ncbi:MAG: type II toxin-antitoxin system VapC family toxin [Thermoleophilia bacterium]|nr:type II toxin-antitoxin system VapC family toxin [Thermoleophilia bacterium]
MTTSSVVFDASALVRAMNAEDENATKWLDAAVAGRLRGFVPELAFVEVTHAFSRYRRLRMIEADILRAALRDLVALPLTVVSLRRLVESAFVVALERSLTVYDACYAVLAEANDAVLVTADARLAATVHRSALLPAAAPPT